MNKSFEFNPYSWKNKEYVLGWQESFFVFFKWSQNLMESSRSLHTLYIYKGGSCCLNDYISIDMHTQNSEKIDISRRDVRVILLHEFRLGLKVSEAANKICSTMGSGVLSTRTAQHWFDRFRGGNYAFDDQPRSGRPVEVDIDLLKQQIE